MDDGRIKKWFKRIWNDPREIEEGEWYILIGVFAVIWMWMVIWS
jgi:hypothetical protein